MFHSFLSLALSISAKQFPTKEKLQLEYNKGKRIFPTKLGHYRINENPLFFIPRPHIIQTWNIKKRIIKI